MSGTSSDPFFWNDWQGDPLLRLCSMAAQGLWMRLLCLAAESRKKGYVLINGHKPSTEELAAIAGQPVSDVRKWLDELDKNGVYSKTKAGIIYSRKMVRDEKKREASSKGGKIGGRVSLEKQTGIHATRTPTPDATRGGTRSPRRAPLPFPSPSPEEEERNNKYPLGSETPLAMDDAGFAVWWKACQSTIPRRASRPRALSAWTKLPPIPTERMIAAWDAYIRDNRTESAGRKFPITVQAPHEWLRNRVHENYLADVLEAEQAARNRERELSDTIEHWNGHANQLSALIGKEKFSAIFLGSKIEETTQGVTIIAKTEFQAAKAELDTAILNAIETKLFPGRAITFMSPKRKPRARA